MKLLLVLALCTVAVTAFKTVPLNNFGYYWRSWKVNEPIPNDAVPGGLSASGHKTYIAKSIYPRIGVIVPGKACPIEKKMWFEFDNLEHERTEDIDILCALNQKRLKWVDVNKGDSVESVARHGEVIIVAHDRPEPIVIGRKVNGNEIEIGKAIINDKTNKFLEVRLTQNGKGFGADNYQVLVYVKNEVADCGPFNVEID